MKWFNIERREERGSGGKIEQMGNSDDIARNSESTWCGKTIDQYQSAFDIQFEKRYFARCYSHISITADIIDYWGQE